MWQVNQEGNMKNFKQVRQQINEAKISMGKLTAGQKLNVIHHGRYAKQIGVKDQNVFGGKVNVLGIGIKGFKDKPNKSQVLAKNLKEFKAKYKAVFKSDEILYGHYFSSLDRLKDAVDMIVDQDTRLKGPATLVWLFEVIEGEHKGTIGFCFISNEPKWEVSFLNKSTEFRLET